MAIAAVAIAIAIGVIVPAGAAAHEKMRSAYTPLGSVAVDWSGSPADGCAAAGVCGVKGSIILRAPGNFASLGKHPTVVLSDPAIARASTPGATPASDGSCASSEEIALTLVMGGSSADPQFTVDRADSPYPPSAGACAGPTASDLAALAFPARPLRHGRGYNLSGAEHFTAGPFAVVAHAHLRAFRHEVRLGRRRAPSGLVRGHSDRALQETASVTYRVTGVSGSLSGGFGAADDDCASFGTCGDQGSLDLMPGTDGEEVTIHGERVVDHAVSKSTALSDLAAGRLVTDGGFGELHLPESLSGTLTPSSGTECTSTVEQSSPAFVATVSSGTDAIALVSDGTDGGFDFSDPLRSRCPGPLSSEVAPDEVLASGALALSDVGQPNLTVSISGQRSWTGDGYAGTFGGTLHLTLQRMRESGGTRSLRSAGRRGG